MLSLPELQSRFFASIARMPGAGPTSFDPTLVSAVEGRGQLGAEERVDIYAQMYYARLVDVLEGDFPRISSILGCERFHDVVSAYLALHPSTSPSLRHLGRSFPAFLRDCTETKDLPFLSDVATLEWARLEVFDAADAEPLRIEHVQTIAPDAWPTLKLQIIPAFQIVQSAWPVHDIWKIAEESTPNPKDIVPTETIVRVWRREFMVYHTKMDSVEQTALASIIAGEPFASVCAALETQMSEEEAASAIGSLVLRWIEDGILASFQSEHL
jgi:hypothetical protein